MEVSDSKQCNNDTITKVAAATKLDRHQRAKGAPTGLFPSKNWESSSPKTGIACTNEMAVSHIGDDAIEGFDPAFAALAVSEEEKTENLSIDHLKHQDRYQLQLQLQYQPNRAPNFLRWFRLEAIELDQFNSTSSSTPTPHRLDRCLRNPRRDARGIFRGTLRNLRVARPKVSTKSRRLGGAR